MHYSNKSYETEWSFLNHIKGNKNLPHFLEGWHRRFSSIVDVHHPGIYKFLSKLTREQAHTEMSRREILRRENPNPSKKAVVSRNKRLFSVVSGLEARTTNGQYIDYLSAVAFNGPGLIRGIFGLRFSEKVKFHELFGLYSH